MLIPVADKESVVGVEAGGLQSGLVFGVVITVLLLADRLVGPGLLTLRARSSCSPSRS